MPISPEYADLVYALKECSFRLAQVIARYGDFSEANAKALDLALAALKTTEEPRLEAHS